MHDKIYITERYTIKDQIIAMLFDRNLIRKMEFLDF